MRYERTGEYRSPNKGEWFESDSGPLEARLDRMHEAWILRAIDDPPPAVPERPSTERVASYLVNLRENRRDCVTARLIAEALRRVRVWEKLDQIWGRNAGAMSFDRLRAILDGDGET